MEGRLNKMFLFLGKKYVAILFVFIWHKNHVMIF